MANADAHYSAALSLADELGMRPLVAHCHLGLGTLHKHSGARQATQHVSTATTMYRQMDMAYWLARAEAEMKDVTR